MVGWLVDGETPPLQGGEAEVEGVEAVDAGIGGLVLDEGFGVEELDLFDALDEPGDEGADDEASVGGAEADVGAAAEGDD